jgi:type II secretory pathway component PulJ
MCSKSIYDADGHSLGTTATFTVQPFQMKPKINPLFRTRQDTSSTNVDCTDSGWWQIQQNNNKHISQFIFNTASVK